MADQPTTTPTPTTNNVNPLLGILATLGGALGGHAIASNASSGAVPPELRQLLQQSVQRQAYQNPEFQAVTQGIYSMLPTYARQGTSLSGSLSNQPPQIAADPNAGGMPDWLKMLLAGAAGSQLRSMLPGSGSGAGGDIGKLLQSLFGGHGGSVQGNQPFPGGTGNQTIGNPYDPTQTFTGWDPGTSDPAGNPYLVSDPGVYYGESGAGATVTDPSGGSGIGPGMQDYYGNSDLTNYGGY